VECYEWTRNASSDGHTGAIYWSLDMTSGGQAVVVSGAGDQSIRVWNSSRVDTFSVLDLFGGTFILYLGAFLI